MKRSLLPDRVEQYLDDFVILETPVQQRLRAETATLERAGMQIGLILIDNVLWSGKVADPDAGDPDTIALRALNQKIRDDARVEACLLPIGDGVMVVRKK